MGVQPTAILAWRQTPFALFFPALTSLFIWLEIPGTALTLIEATLILGGGVATLMLSHVPAVRGTLAPSGGALSWALLVVALFHAPFIPGLLVSSDVELYLSRGLPWAFWVLSFFARAKISVRLSWHQGVGSWLVASTFLAFLTAHMFDILGSALLYTVILFLVTAVMGWLAPFLNVQLSVWRGKQRDLSWFWVFVYPWLVLLLSIPILDILFKSWGLPRPQDAHDTGLLIPIFLLMVMAVMATSKGIADAFIAKERRV